MLKLGFHDTRSVLCTHGLPGLLGWLAQLVLQTRDSADQTTYVFDYFNDAKSKRCDDPV